MKVLKKKKFRDRKIGTFLQQFAPEVLTDVSDMIPDFGALKLVGKLIAKHPTMGEERKLEGEKIVEKELRKNTFNYRVKLSLIISAVATAFGSLINVSENCLTEILTAIVSYF